MDARRPPRSHGFTLGELVLVIVLIGILAALAGPRLFSFQAFASRGFYDEAQAVVRYAQKVAIARRQTIVVCISADRIAVISSADCNSSPVPVQHPVGSGPLETSTAPSGVTLSPVGSFSFDSRGRPNAATTITLNSTIGGEPTRQILIAEETGYVYRN
jgi:MSHA pilin protein MshC